MLLYKLCPKFNIYLFLFWVYVEAIQKYYEIIAKEESRFNFGIPIDHEIMLGYPYHPIYVLQNG